MAQLSCAGVALNHFERAAVDPRRYVFELNIDAPVAP